MSRHKGDEDIICRIVSEYVAGFVAGEIGFYEVPNRRTKKLTNYAALIVL